MVYDPKQKKKSAFTTDDDITNDSTFDFVKAGINKKSSWSNIKAQLEQVFGLGVRFYEDQSAMVADSSLEIGDHAIVEGNRYALYEISNVAAVVNDVSLSSGLVATYQGRVTSGDAKSYADLKAFNHTLLQGGEISNVAYRDPDFDDGGGQFRWDSTDNSANVTADPGQGVYVPPNSDPSGASGCWVRQYNGDVNCAWWGITSGLSFQVPQPDSTDAINAALAFADEDRRGCFLPGGFYFASQINIPRGSNFYGSGAMGFGFSAPRDAATTIKQIDGVETDLIRFISETTGGQERVGSVHLHDLVFRGPTTATTGEHHAISVTTTDGDPASINSLPIFERIVIREFKGSGIYFSGAAAPMLLSNIYAFDNGRYGIELSGGPNYRSFHGEHLYIDSNRLAGMYIGSFSSNQVLSFDHVYCEVGKTNPFGNHPSFAYATPYVFEFGPQSSQGNTVVNITNAAAAANQSTSIAADAMIHLLPSGSGDPVGLIWSNCGVETQAISGGNKSMVYVEDSGVRIPSEVVSGHYINQNPTVQYNKIGGGGNFWPYVGAVPPPRGGNSNSLSITGSNSRVNLYNTTADQSATINCDTNGHFDFEFENSSGTLEAATFDDTTTAGQTRFLIYDVDNGQRERVTVGAADSGGVGFKVLRIPN